MPRPCSQVAEAVTTLTDPGCCEGLKAVIHASLCGLAFLCAGYNAVAFARRHEPHLAANVLLYASLVGLELAKTRHHLG